MHGYIKNCVFVSIHVRYFSYQAINSGHSQLEDECVRVFLFLLFFILYNLTNSQFPSEVQCLCSCKASVTHTILFF